MKTRILTALLALTLPLCAQDASAEKAEATFYKAFYLEKGARDFAGAMTLYEQFLAAAPEHKLAKEAAKQQFGLLNRTGKTKERDAFREKYAALLGNTGRATGRRPAGDAPAGDAPAGDAPRGGRGARGAGDPTGEAGGRGARGQRGNMAERLAELEKSLAAAKEAGDEKEVERLTAQVERMKQFAERGGRGQGQGQGRRGRGIFGDTKLADMDKEQLGQFKDGLERMSGMLDRMKERLSEEQAKALETNLEALNKSLEANKLDEAQKALDKIRESMPNRRRGGGGGVR